MSKTRELLRDRFDELSAEREKILAESMPIRKKRDRLKGSIMAEVRALEDEYTNIEKPLREIDIERSQLARAMGGRTMSGR